MAFETSEVVMLKSGGQPMPVVPADDERVEGIWLGKEDDFFREHTLVIALESTDHDARKFSSDDDEEEANETGENEDEDGDEDDDDDDEDEEDEEDEDDEDADDDAAAAKPSGRHQV